MGLFAFSQLAGCLLYHFCYPDPNTRCMGASGAISGVMGAYLIFYPKARINTYVWGLFLKIPAGFFLLGWFGFQLVYGLLIDTEHNSGVGWLAHIGGFAGGLLFALLHRNYDYRDVYFSQE